ncbi:MAG TPA: hypothetical protein VNJ70_15465 [Thermoanaerobaculia bacterium]|nr:hypothetical protein [Thermoanaerobaculia bacterium]
MSIAGLAATYLKDDSGIDGTPDRAILVGGGLTLVLLAISLGFVDWHYQSAFSAIRDSLARAEAERRIDGPWRAHLSVRSRLVDHFASYLPFVFLFAIGCVGACVGMFGIGIGWWLSAPLVAAAFAFFFYLSSRAKKRDRKMQAEIDDIVARCPASARPV